MGCLFSFLRVIVVAVVLALAGAAIYYYIQTHPGQASWQGGVDVVKDKVAMARLSVEVKAALSLRESLKDLDISISAERDVVTLRGKVPSPDSSRAVESVVASVPGVRQVVNFLEVDKMAGMKVLGADERSVGERVDDEALELKVRAAFKLDRELAGAGFEVTSMRRAVHLSSTTATAFQRKRAVEVAQSVDGVASVR